MRKYLPFFICFLFLLSGCSQPVGQTEPSENVTEPEENTVGSGEAVSIADPDELFTDRDYEVSFDVSDCVYISLSGTTADCGSSDVKIDGAVITIQKGGTYVLSGTLSDGMIIVDTAKEEKVHLVLEGVSIHSDNGAPIYIRQSDKVFITSASNTENVLSNGGSFEEMDGNSIDAVVFSKDDLTLNGEGALTITSPAGHGIVSKDELTFTSGTYKITAASHGISGKDNICIANSDFTIIAGKDGIQANHDEDATLGFIYIVSGTFSITAEGDGISASGYMQLQDGSYQLLCGGGSENAQKKTSDNWGGFGGTRGPGGFNGGRPGNSENSSSATETDSTSIKGLKASGDLVINGGSFDINAADDALHSNGNLTITSGSFLIASGDDGMHADNALVVSGGYIIISESYEGLEGLNITVSSGEIAVIASDDGLNAAGGADQSGFGGFRGGDRFGGGGGGNADSFIQISGGTLYINASGDGVDSNGSLSISGGHTTVCGPTQGDTAVLDYESAGTITGGTFIGTGSNMMAQTFSSSENQGVIALSVGNQSAGTEVVLKDASGQKIVSVTPEENFAIVIFSTPDIQKGESYTVTIGDLSGEFEAS